MRLPNDLSTVSEADIRRLVSEQTDESEYIDFKRDLPGRTDRAKHDVTSDACAFANSRGGDIVYGIDEDGKGRAAKMVPWSDNPDEVVRRIQDMQMNGIEPRVPGVQVRAIPCQGGSVLVIRVPSSWAKPHRTTLTRQFVIREGARNRPLNVPEIRSAFLRSADQGERVRDFRAARIGLILSGETPVPIVPGPMLVFHLVPTDAIVDPLSIDPLPYATDRRLPVMDDFKSKARLNIDGAISAYPNDGHAHQYSQLFRDGYFEAVEVLGGPHDEKGRLPGRAFERTLMRVLFELRQEWAHLGIGKEAIALLSLLRADSLEIGFERFRYDLSADQGRFDRPTILIPDVLLRADDGPPAALRPVFDMVWQAAGLPKSFNYDAAGNWVER